MVRVPSHNALHTGHAKQLAHTVCVCPVKVRAFSLNQELRPANRSVFLTFKVSVTPCSTTRGQHLCSERSCHVRSDLRSVISSLSGPRSDNSGHSGDDGRQQRNPLHAKPLQDPHQTKVRTFKDFQNIFQLIILIPGYCDCDSRLFVMVLK